MDERSLDCLVFVDLRQWFGFTLSESARCVPKLFIEGELRLLPHNWLYHGLLEPSKNRAILLDSLLGPGQVAAADRLHLLTEAVLHELRQELCLELLACVKEGKKFNLGLLGGFLPGGPVRAKLKDCA